MKLIFTYRFMYLDKFYCYGRTMKMTADDRKLGRKIKKLRREVGLSQWELGGKIHKSTTWISLIENGHKRPNLELLKRIASALKVKVADLIPY